MGDGIEFHNPFFEAENNIILIFKKYIAGMKIVGIHVVSDTPMDQQKYVLNI